MSRRPRGPSPNTTTAASSPEGASAGADPRSLPARRRPRAETAPVAARLSATAATRIDTASAPRSPATAGSEKITSANSEPCPRRKPSCTEPGADQRLRSAAAMLSAHFSAISAAPAPSTTGQRAASAAGSSASPTVMKKKPNRRPRNASISACTTTR